MNNNKPLSQQPTDGSFRPLTAKEVADLLNKPIGWVYRHKKALGGFQPMPGASILFDAAKLCSGETHALQDEQRKVARKANDQRSNQDQDIHQQTKRPTLGGTTKRNSVARTKQPDPHGLGVG